MSVNKVRDIELMSQPVLSEGLVFGKCGMTDIDLSCDWQGRVFCFVELKFGSTMLTRGQKYHLEGLVKAITAGGKQAYAILAHHSTEKGQPILARNATISGVYSDPKLGWDVDSNGMSLLEYMDKIHTDYQEERAAA